MYSFQESRQISRPSNEYLYFERWGGCLHECRLFLRSVACDGIVSVRRDLMRNTVQ